MASVTADVAENAQANLPVAVSADKASADSYHERRRSRRTLAYSLSTLALALVYLERLQGGSFIDDPVASFAYA